MHVFCVMEKLVQLKIVHHQVNAMLYSVQNFKNRASEGQCLVIGVSCISNQFRDALILVLLKLITIYVVRTFR